MKQRLSSVFIIFCMACSASAAEAPWVGSTLSGRPCNGGGQGYGPYDYTKRAFIDPYHLKIVESAHFVAKVENLIGGNRGTLDGDLNYTLRAWPNHHRALVSVIKHELGYQKKLRRDRLKTLPECYLQRAIHFSPRDAMSYSLFGYYFRKLGHPTEAVKYYDKATQLEPENAKIAYTYSLLLIELKRYDDAVKFARIAYLNDKAPIELKNKLMKLGVWNE